MSELAFTVHGTPAPQGSMRSLGAGRPTIASNREQLEPWRNAVAAAAAAAMNGAGPAAGPVELDVTFVFARPASHFGTGRNAGRIKASAPMYRDKSPDLDKLVRAICDALTGIAFRDDALVAELRARKHYGSPAAHVVVRPIGGET